MNWLDKFVQPRDGRNNLPAPAAEQSEHAEIRETNEAEEIFERDNEDETVADDESSQLSDKTLAKPFNPPQKKKSKIQGAAKEAVMEEIEFSLMKRMNERLEKRDQQKSEKRAQPDGKELFAQALARDLQQLPQYERCIAKGELRGIIMKHQMAVLEKQIVLRTAVHQVTIEYRHRPVIANIYKECSVFLPRPKHPILIQLYGRIPYSY